MTVHLADWAVWTIVGALAFMGLVLLLSLADQRRPMTRGRRRQLSDLHDEWHVLNPLYPMPSVRLIVGHEDPPVDWEAEGWFHDTAQVPAQPAEADDDTAAVETT